MAALLVEPAAEDFVRSIVSAATQTQAALVTLWAECGTDPVARHETAGMLVHRIGALLSAALEEQRAAHGALRKEVDALGTQHSDLKAALCELDLATDEEYRAAFHFQFAGPLLAQRQLLGEAVAALTCLRDARLARFAAQQAELLCLYNALGTPPEQRKLPDHAALLSASASQTLLKAYQSEIAACRALIRERDVQRIRNLTETVRRLSTELDAPCSLEVNASLLLQMASDAELEEKIHTLEAQVAQLQAEARARLAASVGAAAARVQQLRRAYADLTGHEGPGLFVQEEPSESALHDLQVLAADLEARVAEVREVMASLKRRDAILADEAELLAHQADPTRLTSKHRGMAQQLLKEERTRKAVRSELPRLTAHLQQFARDWPARHGGEAFMYRGKPLLDALAAESPAGGFKVPTVPTSSSLGKRKAEDRFPLSPNAKRTAPARSASALPVLRSPARSPSMCSIRSTPRSTRSDSVSSLYSVRSAQSQPVGSRSSPLPRFLSGTPTKPDFRPPVTPSRIPNPPTFSTPISCAPPRA